MPKVIEHLGVRIDYPENWTVDLGEEEEGDQVMVSSPAGAFWHLSKHPAGTELEGLFDDALSALRSEFKEMDTESICDHVEDRELSGFNVQFFCLDLTNTAWLRGIVTPEATYLLFCQSEDRELQRVGPVFRAMLASLLRNLA